MRLCKHGKYWWVYSAHMSPALNGSSTLEHFKRSNASEIRNGIMFDFYPGLPHVWINRDLYADYTNQEYRASFAVHSSSGLTCRILTFQTCQHHFYKCTVKQKGNKSIYQKDRLVAIETLTFQTAVPLEYDEQKRCTIKALVNSKSPKEVATLSFICMKQTHMICIRT